jgi:acyl-CoA synthetase (AMP-forming)/AMP-acid ligase II
MENIAQNLIRAFQEVPDQTSIKLLFSQQSEQDISYRDLIIEASRYAQALEEAHVLPGEVVILILDHGKDLVCAFYGAILHGAIPSIMPFMTEKLAPDHYRRSLASLFEISAPTAVITYSQFLDEVNKASGGTSINCVLESNQIKNGFPPVEQPDHFDLNGLNRSFDDIVLLQHSSGTTGLQKGVALSHRSVFNQLESYSQALHLNSSDVIVSWLPLYHDMGLIAGFILPVMMRVPLVLMSPFDWVRAPYRLLQAISDYYGTLCWLPNFAYNFCAQKIRARNMENVDLSSLRAVINCSEPMHWKSHRMFLESFLPYGLRPEALATSYAMAENVFAVTQGGIDTPVNIDVIDQHALQTNQIATPVNSQNSWDELHDFDMTGPKNALPMLSAGRPINGTSVKVLDSEGKELPERHIGEITIHSDCMLTGYYHRPDLTKKAFLTGWYLTGDLGYLVDGELYVTGRKKDLIIVGGKNIYPQDLERLAGEVEGVHPGRVVAFGFFNEQTGTEDIVIIAEMDIKSIDSQIESTYEDMKNQIISKIRERVTRGSDVALRHVHVVDRNWLLKTSSGKIARSANRDKFLNI